MPPKSGSAQRQTTLFGFFQKKSSDVASSSPAREPSSTPIRASLPSNGLPTPITPHTIVKNKISSSSDSEDEDGPSLKRRKRKVVSDDEDFVPGIDEKEQETSFTSVSKSDLSGFEMKDERSPSSRASATPRAGRPPAKTIRSENNESKDTKNTRYSWLIDIRDANGNSTDHPSYDSRTLFIPPSAWAAFTPFEKQFWQIKGKLWDTVVFFKKGKFYELYESDADIGHSRFSLKMTDRVNMRMVGVPESSFEFWCAQFIGAGYKVARVDQKETALGASMRNAKAEVKSKDKLVQRELSCVLTAGTLTDEAFLSGADAMYIMAIVQSDLDYGVAFGDTSTARFFLAAVSEDVFATLLAQIRPREVVVTKGALSREARKLIKLNTTYETIWNELWPGESCDPLSQGYWDSPPESLNGIDPLATNAMGLLTWYLKSLNIDRDLFTMGNISRYHPNDCQKYMLMDGQTLHNLEIFQNSFDGSAQGTLWSVLERCSTSFGKRLLKDYVCKPLSQRQAIEDRLDAVDMVNADPDARDTLIASLRGLPDLERMISRIHAGRAKVIDFCRCLDGFENLFESIASLEFGGILGELKASCPEMSTVLEHWRQAFDRNRAIQDQILVPEPGFEEEYDASQEKIRAIEHELQQVLARYKKEIGRDVAFRDIGKDTYLIEVSASVATKRGWEQNSSTKSLKRYSTPETRPLVRRLDEANEEHNQICDDMKLRFYRRFDEHYSQWLAAVKVVAEIDCLLALALTSSALQPAVRPEFVESERSFVEFKDLRHPCAERTEFVENDVSLGGEHPKLILLTGANAAGKSTLLRTTCVAVVLAQIGCYVPATMAKLSIVDRIMSRLGANDNIFANQSTFFVELNETKRILEEATPRSLVILDELGRGTSTYDGLAIANAALWHIATHVGCLGFFATHYATLAAEFSSHPEVCAKRMAIQVDESSKTVTFLYRLEDGASLKSYGMHVANMCGIPRSIIDNAEKAAQTFEVGSKMYQKSQHASELGLCSEFAWFWKVARGKAIVPGELRRVLQTIV